MCVLRKASFTCPIPHVSYRVAAHLKAFRSDDVLTMALMGSDNVICTGTACSYASSTA